MLFKKEYKVGDVVTFFLEDDKEKFIATFKVELESLSTRSFYYLKGFTEKYGEEYGSHFSTWNKILSMYESWAVWASEGTLKNLVKDCQDQKSFKCNCPEGSISPEFSNLGELNAFIRAFRLLLIDKYPNLCSTSESIQKLISEANENYEEFSSTIYKDALSYSQAKEYLYWYVTYKNSIQEQPINIVGNGTITASIVSSQEFTALNAITQVNKEEKPIIKENLIMKEDVLFSKEGKEATFANPLNNIFGNMFKGMNMQGANIEFGFIQDQSIAISPKGIAFFDPETQGYKAWDANNKELVDMGTFAMQGIFMKVPVKRESLKEGDILLIQDEYRIFDGFATKTMKLINPLTGVQTNKQKQTNILNFNVFIKVVCAMNPFAKGTMNEFMKISMMSSMFGGQGMQGMFGGNCGGDMVSQMFQLQMLSSLFGNGKGFDLNFDMDFGSVFDSVLGTEATEESELKKKLKALEKENAKLKAAKEELKDKED